MRGRSTCSDGRAGGSSTSCWRSFLFPFAPSSSVVTRLLRLGFALLLLSVLTVGLTWGLEGDELPRAPRLHGTFRNLDPDFWSASNWTRVRFYLLGLST